MGNLFETIIFCGDLKKSELEKSIALHGGKLWNVRIMGSLELARYALMRAGINVGEELVTRQDTILMMAEIMESMSHEDDAYFHRVNYQDAVNMYGAVSRIRRLVPDNERVVLPEKLLSDGIVFDKKNRTIAELYNRYMAKLDEMNAVDSIRIIRKAIELVPKGTIRAKFVTVSEFMMTPLDKALLNAIADAGSISVLSMAQLFGKDSSDAVRISQYTNNYGMSNEAEYILTSIYENRQAADKSLIIMCSPSDYSQVFYDMSMLYEIPMTFGCGVPIINSSPAKLLNLYYHWKTDGYYGVDALNAMIYSNYFNRTLLKERLGEDVSLKDIVETCGLLRLTDNAGKNSTILSGRNNSAAVTTMSEILSLPLGEFIRQFAYVRYANADESTLSIRKAFVRRLDFAAINEISETFNENFISFMEDSKVSASDIIPQFILGRILKEGSRAGCIHITDVQGGYSVVRDNVYICGLTCKNYPGTPTENYLILDDDFRLFDDGDKYTSTSRISDQKDRLINLVALYTTLGCNINISYAGLNVSELKNENASSIIFDLYRREHGDDVPYDELIDSVDTAGYFDTALSVNAKVGQSYVRNEKLLTDEDIELEMLSQNQGRPQNGDEPDRPRIFVANIYGNNTENGAGVADNQPATGGGIDLSEIELSPSAIDTFINCPNKFMYKYLMKIPDTRKKDGFEVLGPNDEGNLAHKIMYRVATENLDFDHYMAVAEEVVDEFLKENSVLVEADGAEAKQHFLEMMSEAYANRPMGDVLMAEERIECTHEATGLKLAGRPDCIMRLPNSNDCVVIDYKTGYRLSHETDDLRSCIQTIIYAYMAGKNNYSIDHCEYRYLRLNDVVTCAYNTKAEETVDKVLEWMQRCAESGEFGKTDDTSRCEKCEYRSNCSYCNG